jgi:hypothetical protein
VPEEVIAQPVQLLRGRHIGVRVDAGRLHLAIPDVAVQVIALLRRRGHRGELDGDPADEDQRHRCLQRQLAEAERGGEECQPGQHQERQLPDMRV